MKKTSNDTQKQIRPTQNGKLTNHRLAPIFQTLGLHPIVGFGMFAVDSMLFAETVATGGVGWVISIPVAAVLTMGCILIQKFGFGDNWGLAIGKSLIVGLLTAIPTPLPSLISVAGGVIGSARYMLGPPPEK